MYFSECVTKLSWDLNVALLKIWCVYVSGSKNKYGNKNLNVIHSVYNI